MKRSVPPALREVHALSSSDVQVVVSGWSWHWGDERSARDVDAVGQGKGKRKGKGKGLGNYIKR